MDKKEGDERHWNLKKLLGSHESAHVIFTLFTQASVGAFLLLVLGDWLSIPGFSLLQLWSTKMVLLSVLVILTTVGLYKLNMHLGKPHRFYRGFYNLKLSPVSREIAGVTLFYTGLLGTTVFSLFDTVYTDWIAMVFTVIALVGGPVGLYFMYKLYRIPARPFWNHWQTGTAFFGNMLSLGALIIILTTMAVMPLEQTTELFSVLFKLLSLGVALEAVGHFFHSRDMKEAEHEGAASFYWQTTRFGNAWIARNVLLGMSLLLGFYLAMYSGDNAVTLILTLVLALSLSISVLFSRSLFFVTVIPTTMPGAFFWKNQGFVEHAREIGLADNPQHGVVYERHHPFKVNELIQTIKETTLEQKLEQVKAIFMSR
ncbi:dimethyl sulfoxide reductase anchor subunit family protein [methane-oxidizing endosymbiont of Gigantopelta aegis]|uniref:dimethyl sulfoxide reductase anchor subunit family protein n=1 Tax=methane-oxidizing endosymbiont of Gigantopelta aegis TaxID=2794938 RepID=UPI001BE40E87|nr:DmsC/YnfH family molybdoenzyme membrane anchor subunit [methane-oxidizing endosymbiont of Gigantopelta aegis]